jgi:hypothetical protein
MKINLDPRKLLNKRNIPVIRINNTWLFSLSLAILAIFYILTLASGNSWTGDDIQYIRHAINLAEGNTYVDRLYITNAMASISPKAYPPVFPLIISVLYATFGLNFIAMKVTLIGFFIASLGLLKIIFKQHTSSITCTLLILYLGFNPEFWFFKDRILSELPFLFFALSALLLMQLNDFNKTYLNTVLLGSIMYLSYGTREIGLVLPLTLITYELWHYRKVTLHSMLAIIIFILLAMAQKLALEAPPTHLEFKQQLDLLIPSGASPPTTFSHINIDIDNVLNQGTRCYWSLYQFLQLQYLPFSGFFYLFSIMCALIGFVTALSKKIKFTEIYFAGYFCALLLFSGFDGFRYLLPILPIYVMYLFTGFIQLTSFCRHNTKLSVIGALMIIFLNTAGFANKKSHLSRSSMLNTKQEQLYSFISNHTKTTDIIVTRKPRILSFFTQRPASTYPDPIDTPDWFMKYLNAIQAKYLVMSPLLTKAHNKKEINWVLNHHKKELSLVFDNKTFKVYSITNQIINHQ